MEDLGPTTNGVVFLKDLINSAKEEAVNEFEEKVIELTRLIVRAKILDLDHQLKNIVVNETGQVVRIDLECARRRNFVGLPAKEYGAMLSRLVCSHVYACQPEAQRSERFAADLVAALRPPENVLQHAGRGVRENLERQRQRKGIDSQLRLTW